MADWGYARVVGTGSGLLDDRPRGLLSQRHSHGLVFAVFYKDQELKKRYIPDLIVNKQIIAELKSVQELTQDHEAQLINYMRITRKPVGTLSTLGQHLLWNGNDLYYLNLQVHLNIDTLILWVLAPMSVNQRLTNFSTSYPEANSKKIAVFEFSCLFFVFGYLVN